MTEFSLEQSISGDTVVGKIKVRSVIKRDCFRINLLCPSRSSTPEEDNAWVFERLKKM